MSWVPISLEGCIDITHRRQIQKKMYIYAFNRRTYRPMNIQDVILRFNVPTKLGKLLEITKINVYISLNTHHECITHIPITYSVRCENGLVILITGIRTENHNLD